MERDAAKSAPAPGRPALRWLAAPFSRCRIRSPLRAASPAWTPAKRGGRSASFSPLGAVAAAALLLSACAPAPPTLEGPRDRLSPIAAMSQVDTAGFARAIGPRSFVFPNDHGPHPDFKIEWWYFVGNLKSEDGRRFGFQLTFFRQAIAAELPERTSAWATRQLYLVHFALSDPEGERFLAFERTSRAALDLAGARHTPFKVWLEDWSVESIGEAFLPLRLRARSDEASIDLVLTSDKPLVLQGEEGLSRKGDEPGAASYYYSYTRLPARGTLGLGARSWQVEGAGWLDREWSTGGLESDQVGWDWFALQLEDGRDLMLYQVRRRDGGVEPSSHGALIEKNGGKTLLALADVELEVLRRWRSRRGGEYPGAWRVRVPRIDLDLIVEPLQADQELDLLFRYWEGAVSVRGRDASGSVAGWGYVELVGY